MLPERNRRRLKVASICAILLLVAGGAFTLLTVRNERGAPAFPGGPGRHAPFAARPLSDTASPFGELGKEIRAADRLPGRLGKAVFGFYPHWLESRHIEIRADYLSHFCYFSCEVEPESGLPADIHSWSALPLIDRAREKGVRIILAASIFGAERNRTFLASPASRERCIDTLISLCAARGAGGINLDFEVVPEEMRDSLTLFVERLGGRLRKRIPGAELSIDLPAVDREGSFDAARLSILCDQLIVMGYDFHHAGSAVAGPVAPLLSEGFWRREHVRGAVRDLIDRGAIPARILLGVPLYGYEWDTDADTIGARAIRAGKARLYSSIRDDALYGVRRLDTLSGTVWSVGRQGSGWRQLWFDDSASLARKYRLVDSAGLGGIALWALGYDGGRREIWNGILDAFLRVEKIDFESPFLVDQNDFLSGSSGVSRLSRCGKGKTRGGACLAVLLADSLSSLQPWHVRVPLGNLLLLPRQGAVRFRLMISSATAECDVACLVRYKGSVYRTEFQPLSGEGRWTEYTLPMHALPDSIVAAMIEDAQALPTLDGLLFEAPGRDPEMRILIDDISTVAFPIPATSDPGEIRLAEGALFISPRIFGKEIEAFDFQRYEPAGNAWRTISHRRLGRMQYFEQELSDTAALPARGVYRLVVSDRSGRRFPWKQWRTDLRPRVLAGERGGHSDPLRLLLEVKLRARYSLDLYSPSGECLLRLPERLMEPGIREIFVPGRELAGNPAGAYFARVRSGDQFTTSKLVLTN